MGAAKKKEEPGMIKFVVGAMFSFLGALIGTALLLAVAVGLGWLVYYWGGAFLAQCAQPFNHDQMAWEIFCAVVYVVTFILTPIALIVATLWMIMKLWSSGSDAAAAH